MRKTVRTVYLASLISVLVIFGIIFSAAETIPNEINLTKGEKIKISQAFKMEVKDTDADLPVHDLKKNRTDKTSYDVDVKLLGVIPIKSAHVKVTERMYAVPSGKPFGVKMYTNGVIVVGMSDVDSKEGTVNPAKEAGLKEGDAIISINGKEMKTNEDVAKAFESCDGRAISVKARRNDMEFSTVFKPALSVKEKRYKAGLWVRDSTAGVGTLTYYIAQSGIFAGLGHAICDVDTGEIMPLKSGEVVSAKITGIYKGTKGSPGELCGIFEKNESIGSLLINGDTGVYGVLSNPEKTGKSIPVATNQEVQLGKAQILTTIDGKTPKYYEIEIIKISYNSDAKQKNMIIKVTDKNLIKATGGIVQGMSGSPIIQNNMLVGAVTHVFVNNPQQGYAIFAENMINTSNSLNESLYNKAS